MEHLQVNKNKLLSAEKELLYLWDVLCKYHGTTEQNLDQRHEA